MSKHDIGQIKRDEAARNRARIEAWFKANPFGRQNECAKALGLSIMVVGRHCKVLREEYRQHQPAQTATV